MNYKIREKFWSWGDDFHITDPEDRPIFRVRGKVFSWGDNLSFQDLDGRELAHIKQKFPWGTETRLTPIVATAILRSRDAAVPNPSLSRCTFSD